MAFWLKTLVPILALVLAVCGQYDRQTIMKLAEKNKKLPHTMCGESSETVFEKKIVNGEPAALGTYPWMAALGFTKGSSRNPSWSCGGSLITDQYVLTAAHCLDPARTQGYRVTVVRLGDLDLASDTDNAKPIDVEVESTTIHPQYNNSLKTNDIGLVKLKRKVQFHDLLKPICLPSPEFQTKDFAGHASVVAGWGTTETNRLSDKLLEAELRVIGTAECRRNLTSVFPNVVIDKRVVCAYSAGKDSCQGDSGGPLMMFRRYRKVSRMYILGVVSYGYGCAKESYPGVYNRVSEYMAWIIETLDI